MYLYLVFQCSISWVFIYVFFCAPVSFLYNSCQSLLCAEIENSEQTYVKESVFGDKHSSETEGVAVC